jgi:hypothetical protein
MPGLADVLTYLRGRLGGLFSQSLDLVSNHREAAAGVAGAGGFDRRIQRQKIGLLGDGLDQIEHAVDALGRRRETFNFGNRPFGPKAGLFDDTRRLTDLSADLLDRIR